MPKETYYDIIVNALKDNPIISFILLAGVVFGGLATILKNFQDIAEFFGFSKKALAEGTAELFALVKQRGEDVIVKMQAIIEAVPATKRHAPSMLTQQLEQFKNIHERHLKAIEKSELVLQHDLHAEALKVIADFNRETQVHYGEIIKSWYDALPRKYIDMPSEGTDPAYEAVARDAQQFAKQTIDVLKTIEYPDVLPAAAVKPAPR